MERQYIGARYVPKFAEPVEWNKALSYEAMTIVTHLGNSFTSKKPVPAGIEINNTEYWVNTGNYNAQIESYRQDVTALSTDVTTLSTKVDTLQNNIGINSIVCIGDSYGGSYPGNRWIAQLKTVLGISDEKFFWNAAGGGGFAANDGDGHNFLWRLSSLAGTMTEEQKNGITQIIVCGGANDAGVVGSVSISTKISEFCAYARSNFPNAEICIGFIGVPFNGEPVRKYQVTMTDYQRCSTNLKTRYLNGVEWVMYNTGYMSSDLLHPNDSGSAALATAIANAILSGSCDITYEYGDVQVGTANVTGSFVNGIVTIQATRIDTGAITNWKLNGTRIHIGDGIFPFAYGDVFNNGNKIPAIILMSGADTLKSYFPGYLVYSAGKWYLEGYYLNPNTADWDTYSATKATAITAQTSFSVIE